ncbi:hypothetical protein LWI29_007948 [Acer saccharum]|uniref:non-specific serine/threonine protein kinase n=1 Tax=Acer saccharum TaxID=4024 RepID=A0AA39SLV8_ACESA|nr:hypothetical protein LWI29_007948 [Acer saccharum]
MANRKLSCIKKRKLRTNKNPHQHTQRTFQTLVSAIRSSQGLKPPVLSSLYRLLKYLSSNETMMRSNGGATLDYLNLEFNQNGLTVTLKEIRDLSDILFEQLDSRFKQIYDGFQDASADQANGQAVSHSNSWASFEELILILRCCMVILSLMPDLSLVMEKGQVLLSVLRRLISSSNADDDCCTAPIAEGFASSVCSSGPSDPTPKHKYALLQLSHILSNLTGLRYLVLSNNHFYGTIPPELSKLRNLHFLQLDGNNLRGRIPESFAQFSNLTLLFLFGNYLTGTLPASFFANCTSLANIDISYNFFTGKIPGEIGNSPGLWNLNLYNNQFTGQVPESLINTSMYSLDLEYNHLSGELPSEIVAKLPSLQNLHLSHNNMVSHERNTDLDPFFSALGNCTDLDEIELAGMGLGGALPSSIGRLNLSQLLLQENHITGSIPWNIANVSSLMTLNLTSNLLNGTIPEEISLLSKLEQLFLSPNLFSGEIPVALGQLSHLGLLDLSHNKFSVEIPASLGNLVLVNSLFLNNNFLSGSIPSTLGQCYDLYRLDLSYNRLTGSIPPEISGIREIRIFLNLSHNELEGPLPIELSKLENVQEIDLSSNRFTGYIFLQISSCIALRMINLSHSSLQGHLPDSLGDLKNLESIDVSGNQLSGKIPISLNKIHTLNFINLSFNEFKGMIPSGIIFDSVTNMSFLGNHNLCGEDSGIPICSHKRHLFRPRIFLIIFILVICISVFLSTICCVIGIRRLGVMFSSTKSEAIRKPRTPELMHNFPRISYRELADATGGFDGQRLVGTGSFGRVYKGVLSDGTAIAVKVLQFQSSNSTENAKF